MLERSDTLDPSEFARQPLPQKILQVNDLYGKRLWSEQLAHVWLRLLSRCNAPAARQILLRDVLELAPWMDTDRSISGELLDSFRLTAGVSQVHVVISCEKYLEKARRFVNTIRHRLNPVVIVVGDPHLQLAEFRGDLLVVPSPDTYEHLTRKVNEALLAVRSAFGSVSVLKMDDDLVSTGEVPVPDFSGMDYVGHAVGDERLDRAWHFGKTRDRSLHPYAKRFRVPWARGPIYWLSARSLDVIVRELLLYPGQLEGEVYEDKFIADTLAAAGISVTHYDVAGAYALREDVPPDPTASEMAMRN
jgi:hypothetical protein